MSFKDKGWAARFEQMGDEAEGVFEDVCAGVLNLGFARYGLNRPPIQMHKLPARIRYTPDYLMSGQLVEVQGFGRDQKLKLKVDKWMSLHFWNTIHPVYLFVWDTTNKRWALVKLEVLDGLLGDGDATIEKFPEGKTYLSFDAEAVFGASEKSGDLPLAEAA